MKIETDLVHIEQMGEERLGENLAFRTFLKGLSISDEKLDAIVHQINDEVTAQIDCTSCANCCKMWGPGLDEEDIPTFALGLQMPVSVFKEQYVTVNEPSPPAYQIREAPCPFLEDNLCSNYECRPAECRSYPHLHKKDFRSRLFGVVDNYAICPIVFNVYEQLKVNLWRDLRRAPSLVLNLIAFAECRIMCAMSNENEIETAVLPIDPQHPQLDPVRQAARIISAGGLVAFPTETVYGLGANALDAEAVTRIFTAKGRPAYDPVIVHVADTAMLADLVTTISPVAARLTERFWPGALTLVLPKSDRVPMVVTAQGPTVAVRCPNHPVAKALIEAAGCPIAAPSANRFSHTSPTTAQHVFDDLNGKIDLILDGGPTSIGVESTVLDLSGDRPVLLRPGGVSLEELEATLGQIEQMGNQEKPPTYPSPGMLDRHYAPTATLILFSGPNHLVQNTIWTRAEYELSSGRTVGLLVADEDGARLSELGCPLVSLGPEADAESVARRLFEAMRTLDDAGVELILARDFAPQGLGLAIRDRLRRAAGEIVSVGEQ